MALTRASAAVVKTEELVPNRNKIINGAMEIDQRYAGQSVTHTASNYTLDRWRQGVSAASKCSVQQSTIVPSSFKNSLLVTSLSAYTVGSGEANALSQKIEGFNIVDLAWGTASAKTVTVSFWVRSSLTGTFGGALRNNAGNRSYPFTYTISNADTWEQKSITVPGETTGTWETGTSSGIELHFGLGVGATYVGTAGAWASADYRSASGTVSVLATNAATWYITGVQLEVGSVATPFERRPYGTELALCQRYFYMHAYQAAEEAIATGVQYESSSMYFMVPLKVTMRTTPSVYAASGTDYYRFYRNSTNDTFNSISILSGQSSENIAFCYNNSEISGTAGQAGNVQITNSSAYVGFSAEL